MRWDKSWYLPRKLHSPRSGFQGGPASGSNKNLEMLVFGERGKPEYPEKNLSEQSREPTTNSTHIWRPVRESNPGHIGGRRVLSPLRQPCSPRWDQRRLDTARKVSRGQLSSGSLFSSVAIATRAQKRIGGETPTRLLSDVWCGERLGPERPSVAVFKKWRPK